MSAAGSRQVLLELPGHVPRTLTVEARVGSTTTVHAKLEPRFGEVALEVVPAAAQIAFLKAGVAVPARLEAGRYRLPVGAYTAVASASGYVTARTPVIVTEEAQARAALWLTPVPLPTGRLLVTTGQVPAEVFIDGRRAAVTPATLTGLSVGEHSVEVRAGKRVARRRIKVQADRVSYVEIELPVAAR